MRLDLKLSEEVVAIRVVALYLACKAFLGYIGALNWQRSDIVTYLWWVACGA